VPVTADFTMILVSWARCAIPPGMGRPKHDQRNSGTPIPSAR
jgi:hypothetical protein